MSKKRKTPEKDKWHLDPAEVIEGAEDEGGGRLLLWFRHVPTGIEALARTPLKGSPGSGGMDQQAMVSELKPLLWDELEGKVARRLRIPDSN